MGRYENRPNLSVGVRWYVDDGIGFPQSYGKPQWFMLPDNLGSMIISILPILKRMDNFI